MEAFKGRLAPDGNRSDRAKPQAGFTARLISRAVAKAELSEPTVRLVKFILLNMVLEARKIIS